MHNFSFAECLPDFAWKTRTLHECKSKGIMGRLGMFEYICLVEKYNFEHQLLCTGLFSPCGIFFSRLAPTNIHAFQSIRKIKGKICPVLNLPMLMGAIGTKMKRG